jgi:hypothetical protein
MSPEPSRARPTFSVAAMVLSALSNGFRNCSRRASGDLRRAWFWDSDDPGWFDRQPP